MTDKNSPKDAPSPQEVGEALDMLLAMSVPDSYGVPSFTPGENGVCLPKGDDWTKSLGAKNPPFAEHLTFQMSRVVDKVQAMDAPCRSNDDRQFIAFAVAEIEPRDGIEAMLALQMAGLHIAVLRMMFILSKAENCKEIEISERAIGRLQGRFTASMETLRKHRNKGQQTVTVQHVNVEGGGQAIVGNVQSGGGYEKE